MASKYFKKDFSETPPTYRRDFSSPSTFRKADFLSGYRPSTTSLDPPVYGSSHTSASSKFNPNNGVGYSPGAKRSSISSSYSSNSPTISNRAFSKPTTYNRSASNDFGVSYSPKPPSSTSYSNSYFPPDHSRSSASNLTPFESRHSSGSSVSPGGIANNNKLSSSYEDSDYKSIDLTEERFRILTSRATSPGPVKHSRAPDLVSDTQTERYPLTDTKRRRQLRNVYVQVDPRDLDESKSQSISFQKSSPAGRILPKQSGFVPKNRTFRNQSESETEDERPKASPQIRRTNEQSKEIVEEDYLPKQSSFLKKLKHDEVLEVPAKQPPRLTIDPTVSLKESVEKVKSWKKQMKLNLPDYKDEDDDKEWRKKMSFNSREGKVSGQRSLTDKASEPSNATMSENECIEVPQRYKTDQRDKGVSVFLDKTSSHASLPDLVEFTESNEEAKKAFIGRMKDIDNLLDFEDVADDNMEDDELQVSSWVDDGIGGAEDIDDLLDGDVGSTSTYPGGQTSGPGSKSRSSLISSNPFMRQTSSRVTDDAVGARNEEEEDDDNDPQKLQKIVADLCDILETSGQLSIERLIDKCPLSERSAAHVKLQNKLKAESKFSGFETMQETLQFLKLDVAQLENCAVSIYKECKSRWVDGDNSESNGRLSFLRPQSSLDNENNDDDDDDVSIKMAVRVHALVDCLVKGKDLRRVLFSLKKIFKNEPDCIKEFVYSDGLATLVKIAEDNASNSSYQCYILRALGQLMLNIDGMNGIVSVNKVVQWLYHLVASSTSLVSRTALRLLIMFVSYSECNSFLFIQAVSSVSLSKGKKMFSNMMDVLKKSGAGSDRDPCVLVLLLLNKTLESVPDQDSFYDVVDSLAEQGLDKVFWTKTSYGSAKPDFVEQMKMFENMVKQEDVRQLEQQLSPTDDSTTHERRRVPSRTANRRSAYYSKRDDVLQKELNRRKTIKLINQKKLINDFENNKISNVEQDKSSDDFKKDLAEGTFSGLIGRAKDGLIMSQASSTAKLQRASSLSETEPKIIKSEGQLRWEEAEGQALERLKKNDLKLNVREIDFNDVTEVDEINFLDVSLMTPSDQRTPAAPQRYGSLSIVPQPPPCPGGVPLPPPPPGGLPPPPGLPPLPFAMSAQALEKKETSKTLRLHWREARSEYPLPSGRMGDTLWSRVAKEIGQVNIDKEAFATLFHSKTTDLKLKSEGHKKELALLDSKRSNTINIALTVLPQASLIKMAILNMDHNVLSREAVEKLVVLLPSEEEKAKLVEAQLSSPDAPLGQAEQFLLTVSGISEVKSRLNLWLFMLDFDSVEMEISDALLDLRQAMEQLKICSTLKHALAVLLAVGNCLNSSQAKGFTLDFLSKVPDIKDSIKKRSLLHHLVSFVIQFHSDATDIFSEITSVTKCSRVDWEELEDKLKKLEEGCKASWDDIRAIVKHDNNLGLKNRLSAVLSDFAERTMMLKMVHRRLTNRFRRFLLYFGYQPTDIVAGNEVKMNHFFKVVSGFALEWRATRAKILHNKTKKEAERDRKMAASPMSLSLSRSTHGSVSADESLTRNVSSKPPLVPLANFNGKTNYVGLLSPAPKVSKWPSSSSIGNASETESAYETGDEELFGAVLRSATASPSSQKRHSRENRRKASVDRTWRSSSRDRNGY